ncbi:MAG: C40 family peptidase [Lewinellaceae bacterium]|nr:C40 family peptidase [Phaeodactylibacter sp.]MCB9038728.1 C40 family peptidase [Lewinellaceae bacterium]
MKSFPLLAFLALALLACQKQEGLPPEVDALLEQVRQAHAPDKRVALFDVAAEQEGGKIVLKGESNLPDALRSLEQRLREAGFSTLNRIRILPDTSLQGKSFGVVNLSACNIRSEPRHSAELATQSTLGTPLRVYKESGGWFLVQTPDSYLGWLDPGGFVAMTEAEYRQWQQAEKVAYLPDQGFSLAAPATGAQRVSDLLAGNILLYQGSEGGFSKLQYPDGRAAYVPDEDVMNYELWLASRDPSAEKIIETAFRFMGRPYLWGGTSGKGVDCSGFTKTVFYLNGLLLPRDASQQVHVGVPVETDTTLAGLQPGDLLFFGRKATEDKPEKITHVAIYLGEGKIIHSSGIVKVESLRRADPDFTEYRLNSFVRARRMLQDPGQNGVPPLKEVPQYKEM